MKTSSLVGLCFFVAMSGLFAGCEIITEEPPTPIYKPAKTVIINELFILAPPNQNPFRWIEFYNPTNRTINISKWTLGFKTKRTFIATDTLGQVKAFAQDLVPAYHDVPLRSFLNSPIQANRFLTLVSNRERMENYTASITLPDPINQGDAIFLPQDTVAVDSIVLQFFDFIFQESDQLVLKDTSGTVVDVFRYGNYVFAGPGADPYPNNRSLGAIIPYQSFARFAGAYTSGASGDAALGNSAEDFYVTGQAPRTDTRPIPQWLSQLFKE